MATAKITITLRVSQETYDALSDAAEASKSSMNSIAEEAILRASKKIIAQHEKKSSSENNNEINDNSEISAASGK